MTDQRNRVTEKTLLAALGVEGDDQFKLATLEALASLLLMVHWLRGMFTWATWTGALKFPGEKYPAEQEGANFQRLNHNLELYEELLWKFLPPRAMLQQLRLLRERGYLDDDFLALLEADNMGRFDPADAQANEVIRRGNEVDGRTDIPLR